MKAAIALLTDSATANYVNQLAWRLHLSHRLGIGCRRIPPHISLKQPFDTEDLPALEQFCTEFARDIAPVPVSLGTYQLWETPAADPTSGILSRAVADSGALRSLHHRLNRELAERFGPCPAPFDGDGYSFHLTIAAGEATAEAYRAAYATLGHKPAAMRFEAPELALFVYDNDHGRSEWQYLLYRSIAL